MTPDKWVEYKSIYGGADCTAVEFIDSIGGAVALLASGQLYIEIVEGHLSGLLQHGFLSVRLLFDLDSRSLELAQTVPQVRLIDPITLQLCSALPDRITALNPVAQARAVAASLSELESLDQCLFEIMLTEEAPVFVDVHPYPWRMKFRSVFAKRRESVFKSAPDSETQEGLVPLHPKSWTPECTPRDAGKYSVDLNDFPLTSHFATYGLRAGLSSVYNHS